MRPNWNTINLTVAPNLEPFCRIFLLQESVSNSRSDQLKKALRSVPDWAQIKVCGVPVRAHGLYQIFIAILTTNKLNFYLFQLNISNWKKYFLKVFNWKLSIEAIAANTFTRKDLIANFPLIIKLLKKFIKKWFFTGKNAPTP